ncbi:MAG TPA: DUF6600 domain-containing protein [Desulfatiglandales bacterium]|nr:DUF6600 domain-containing protein [Desulfatiglandales bacterium]
MKNKIFMTGFMAYMLFAVIVLAAPSLASDTQTIQVGRIYYMKGEVLRYVPDENDWVAVVRDAPFGTEDTLFSGSKGMAEMFIPNGAWIRIGNNTQIQFISLEPDLTGIDLASGVARFYNKGSDMVVKTTTPFGYVLSDPDTVFDLYVGADSMELVAIKGTVSFVHEEGYAKYNVSAGSPSILADQNSVAPGDGTVDLAWDQWNKNRDIIWADRLREDSPSARYLPHAIIHDAYCLDAHGRWEMVYYEGRDRWFWRPSSVRSGWSPFTIGIWTEWCGDQTWIPLEPFGYITHHYGNWIYARNCWYWAPPVVSMRVNLHLLDIGFFWYPGRVSWIFRGDYIGWVPLSPRETYYSRHNWGGPHHKIARGDDSLRISISTRDHAYSDRAVIVRKDHFRGVENYRNVRVFNVHPHIINDYNAAPVVDDRVIKNYTEDRRRHNYANTTVIEKPREGVVARIRQNAAAVHKDRKENAAGLQQRLKLAPDGRINRHTRIEAPRVTDNMAPADTARHQRPPEQAERSVPATPSQQQERVTRSGRVTTPPAIQRQRTPEQAERLAPATPPQRQERVTRSGQVTTPPAIQRQRTPEQAEQLAPATPPQRQEVVAQPGQIRPSAPAGQDKDRNDRIKKAYE